MFPHFWKCQNTQFNVTFTLPIRFLITLLQGEGFIDSSLFQELSKRTGDSVNL